MFLPPPPYLPKELYFEQNVVLEKLSVFLKLIFIICNFNNLIFEHLFFKLGYCGMNGKVIGKNF